MKQSPAEGERRRCASLGRRYDNGINIRSQPNDRRNDVRLPQIGPTNQRDNIQSLPGYTQRLPRFYRALAD